MTEEQDPISPDDLEAHTGNGEAPTFDSEDADDAGEEEVTELPVEIEVKTGNTPEEELEKLRPLCALAEQNYQGVLAHIKTIRSANQVLQKFHAREGDLTPKDVDKAKREFNDAKKSYIQLGNQINQGIKQVHVMAKTYPQDLLMQGLYSTYLAKLLASLETRYETEHYVARLASFTFYFEREDIVLTVEEERRDLTLEKKQRETLAAAGKEVARLEARYQKRQLQNRMRQEERPTRLINQLVRISKQDPEDINTYIWIASLLAEQMPKQRDPSKRLEYRDDILSYCQRAFSQIDDFLNLQGIQNQSERDKRRSGYLKSITQIRKPLMKGS